MATANADQAASCCGAPQFVKIKDGDLTVKAATKNDNDNFEGSTESEDIDVSGYRQIVLLANDDGTCSDLRTTVTFRAEARRTASRWPTD